jgi:hypothetical protein
MPSTTRLTDGTLDFTGGCDSSAATTVQSAANPNGLARNQTAWMNNCTCRDFGITPRDGFSQLIPLLASSSSYWQGGYLYTPLGGNPYLVCSISGHIYSVLLEAPFTITDLSAKFGLFNPSDPTVAPRAFFAQAESFLIIQAGDYQTATVAGTTPTLPLFWDGATLRRSNGLNGNVIPPQTPMNPLQEIPAATCMFYYQGILWYAQFRTYSGGDIVGAPSGTEAYDFTDAVLKVTENPLAIGGDGFTVPANSGNITALNSPGNLNSTLGQGFLYIFTRSQIFTLQVPANRAAWIATGNAATGATQGPIQNVVQLRWGATSDIGVVGVNSDLFYPSLEPGVRSLMVSERYFQQWANVSVSKNEQRIIESTDRSLLPFCSGVNYANRMLMLTAPVQMTQGVVWQGIMPLDFDIISSFRQWAQPLPPAWEGAWQGLNVLQIFEADYGGLERCFMAIVSSVDGSIQIWEMIDGQITDGTLANPDNRIAWYFETPAFTWGKEFDLKSLDGLEIWFDSVYGTVDMTVSFRPDSDTCWYVWQKGSFCSARNAIEDVNNPATTGYPAELGTGQKFPIMLGRPPADQCQTQNARPVNQAHQFQLKIELKGYCRVRGLYVYAVPIEKTLYQNLSC